MILMIKSAADSHDQAIRPVIIFLSIPNICFAVVLEVLMILCTCEKCRYTFEYPRIPEHCPDCGAGSVRKAPAPEVRDFARIRKILREEIRLGLWEDGSSVQPLYSAPYTASGYDTAVSV